MSIFTGVSALIFLAGCGSPNAAEESKTVTAKLNRGTEIKLMLLEKLDSGGTEIGHRVPFVVCENVTDATGKILIPMGTPVTGEITQSRAAGALSSVMNSPARLRMKLNPIDWAQGGRVELIGEMDSEDTDFGFTKDTISTPAENLIPNSAFEDLAKKQALTALTEIIEGSKSIDDVRAELSDDQQLNELLHQLGYSETEQILERQKSAAEGFNRIASTLGSLRKGDVSALSGGEATLVLAAIEELGGLASEVGDRIKGIFKGRNIRPAIGSRITVFVAGDTEIQVRS